MNINLQKLEFLFEDKPLLIGGKAKEYYNIRKAGDDIDFVISDRDYQRLARKYPDHCRDLFGDLGVAVHEFEIWRTICLFDYEFLARDAKELPEYKIISLDRLLFLTALAMKKEKYLNDLYLTVEVIINEQAKKLR